MLVKPRVPGRVGVNKDAEMAVVLERVGTVRSARVITTPCGTGGRFAVLK